jgi:hypothetical protein
MNQQVRTFTDLLIYIVHQSVEKDKSRMYVIGEEESLMKISTQTFQLFIQYCYAYFRKEREGTTLQVVESLRSANPSLFRRIEKATGRGKTKAYIGGTLLKRLKKEGWLEYDSKGWRVKTEWGKCNYCFKSLEDIYLIDMDQANKWTTSDPSMRSDWYDLLMKDEQLLEGKVTILNEVRCPHCDEVVESKRSSRAIDSYYYCDDCYGVMALLLT